MGISRTKTFSGFIWRFLERCGAQIVTFVVSIVLARILDPAIYGTVALVTVFITILQVFVDSGLGTALIQKKDSDDVDFSTVFYFNLIACSVLYLIMFFLAPLIARFYGTPEITPVIRVLSLTLIISGVRNIQQAYVSKTMQFKKFFFSTIGATIGSAIVGIVMAYKGMGVWALVGQNLFNQFIGTIILWITVRWRPIKAFSLQRLKVLFSFGWKLLVSALLDTGYHEARSLIIGKKYSANDLAYYNRGKTFPNLIVTNVNSSIDSVLLPTMSQEQDNRAHVKSMTRRAIRTSTYIMAPLMIGLAICAEPIVRLLLTDKWLPCVLFLRIFCISYLFYPIHTANLNAIKAVGRSDMFLKLEIIKKAVGVALILSTMWISVEAMAYSLFISTILSTIINAFPNKKLLKYSWFEQMKDILPNIGLALIMGVGVFCVGLIPLPTIVTLILQIVVGAGIYIGISTILKLEVFKYLLTIIKVLFKKEQVKQGEEMRISDYAKRVEPSLARALFNEAKNFDDVVDLTLGDPDFSTPENIKNAACEAIRKGLTHYSANAGLKDARRVVAKNIKENWGIEADIESEIIITVGGMEALFLSLACLINPNDEVVIFTPYYVNYIQMVRFFGGIPKTIDVYNNVNGFDFDESTLRNAISEKTVAIIINSPNNPTGDVFSGKLLSIIAKIAEEKDIVMISDEVYRTLIYDGIKHESILNKTTKKEKVVLIDSCSKEFCMTGYRVGYAYGNKELIRNMVKLQENVAACAPLPSQFALIEAYSNTKFNKEKLCSFQDRRDYLYENINKIDKLSCVKPKGTFYIFVNIEQTGLSSLDFALKLLREEHLAVVPGETYGKNYSNYVRIAFTKEISLLEQAVNKLKHFIANL